MPTSRLDVAVEALHDLVPMIAACARIVGSDMNEHSGTVRLVLDGAAIPADANLVTCTVEKQEADSSVTFKATFKKVA